MKPAISSSRNLRELSKAEKGLLPDQQRAKMTVLIGALSTHVSPEAWDQCLNTTYGYIASCRVKLKTSDRHSGHWYATDDNTYDGPGSILGVGKTEREAIDDFWEQWKEKREAEI